MQLVINGESRDFPALSSNSTVAGLVEILTLKSDRVALELNGLIVSRALWTTTRLTEADRIEIVHFVGGGSLPDSSPEESA